MIINDPNMVQILDMLRNNVQTDQALYDQLLQLFRNYRSDYQPISGHEYVPYLCPKFNQLIGLHKILHQKLYYEHQPLCLIKVNDYEVNLNGALSRLSN